MMARNGEPGEDLGRIVGGTALRVARAVQEAWGQGG
jgi:hypothetical protein